MTQEPRTLPSGPLYFCGIGGAGMSAIAFVLAKRGQRILGSDPGIAVAVKARLEAVGCEIFTQHDPAQIPKNCAAVIVTDAIKSDHSELIAARERGIPIFSRPEALGSLVNAAKTAICVAGTHGKTTTTGMIASILIHAGLNPTVLIGGDLPLINGNAQNGDPDLVIAEACEAYGGLDWLKPTIAVITNCEPDHLDFHKTEENFYKAFARFVNNSHSDGKIIISASAFSDLRIGLNKEKLENAIIFWYKRSHKMIFPQFYPSSGIIITPEKSEFTLRHDLERVFSVYLPGTHNVVNALAAILASRQVGVAPNAIAEGLATFTGTGRRFERLGEVGGVTVIDDYAHHPTEIRATLQAARQAFPDRRIMAVFQPHLPSRTRDFLTGFAEALSHGADAVYLTDIYLAREKEQVGLIEELAAKIEHCVLISDRFALPSRLQLDTKSGDVLIFMGAGNIREQAEAFLGNCV